MLTIFRRHLRECGRTSRRYRRCACPIHVEGSLRGEKIRKALDLTSWEAASDLIRSWEVAGEIGIAKSNLPEVQEAISKYIAEAQEQNLNPESIKKMRDAVERLFGGYCTRKGYRQLRQLGIEELRAYRTELSESYAVSSVRTRLEYMRAFFRFSEESGWLKVNPARKVRLPKSNEAAIDTFTSEEIDHMLAAADSFNQRGVYGYGNRKRIRAMILLLQYSGLRISDASVLERSRLDSDKLSLPTRKTGSIIWLPLPASAVRALNESPSDDRRYFFWNNSCLPTPLCQ